MGDFLRRKTVVICGVENFENVNALISDMSKQEEP